MTTKQTYVATECGHENVIEFGSSDDVFERRTIGCNTCGTTTEHVRSDIHASEESDDDTERESEHDESGSMNWEAQRDMDRDIEENKELYLALADDPDGDDLDEALDLPDASEDRYESVDVDTWADDADYFDELQPVAKQLGITANQSADDLRDDITAEDEGDVRDAIQVVELEGE